MAKLLILGGTVFLGRHLVASARARGHVVTLFNRGNHPELFPDVENLRGDRTGDLAALRGRSWDAVLDPSGYVPRFVGAAARLLMDQVERYVFISSISVCADLSRPPRDEAAPVAPLPDGVSLETMTDWSPELYGALKAECERTVESILPGRALNIRPGLIVGPYDPSDRFTYWPHRVAQGGNVLAPGNPGRSIQFIDARDLADWIIRMVEVRQAGVFQATGPDRPLPMRELFQTCLAASGAEAEFTWVDDSFLLDHQVVPYTELPLWIPGEDSGFNLVDCRKAIASGLCFRPLLETVTDTLAWDRSRPEDQPRKNGLAPAKEASLLQEWQRSR